MVDATSQLGLICTPAPSTALRWNFGFDALALLMLAALANGLIFRHVATIGMSSDGFLLTYASFAGDLQAFNFVDIKDPGRPFVGLAIKLAELSTGGAATGLNFFMAATYTISAALIYAIVRLAAPQQPIWAVIAASQKLVWSANAAIFDNSGVIIYFAETLFWLAVLNLILFARRPTIASGVVIVACVAVVSGTYQSFWPLIALAPVTLLSMDVIRWGITARYGLILWIGGAFPVMVWSALSAKHYVEMLNPPIATVGRRVASGLWNAVGASVVTPFLQISAIPKALNSPPLLAAMLAMLCIWALAAKCSDNLAAADAKSKRIAWSAVILGLVAITALMATTAIKFEPDYHSRFMALPAGAVILFFGGVTALTADWIGERGNRVTLCLLAASAIVTSAHLNSVAIRYAKAGFVDRRFWEDVVADLPRIDEGTVIVFEDAPPEGVPMNDAFATSLIRAISNTHLSFFAGEHAAVRDRNEWLITTNVDIEQTEPIFNRKNQELYPSETHGRPVIDALYYDRTPRVSDAVTTARVSEERVVAMKWDARSLRLYVDTANSNLKRVHADIPSTFGQRIFPAKEIARDRRLSELGLTGQ